MDSQSATKSADKGGQATDREAAGPALSREAGGDARLEGNPGLERLARLSATINGGPHVARLKQRKALVQSLGRRAADRAPAPIQRRANATGLPDRLKDGVEALSGIAMDDVRVHYGSAEPARLNALAFTRGADIHVAPGQERHLPHEAWHVVQQAQGRVKPTMQLKGGIPVNGDMRLEDEATAMGAKAMARGAQDGRTDAPAMRLSSPAGASAAPAGSGDTVQCWPPASPEAADKELAALEASLYRQGIQLRRAYMGREQAFLLDSIPKNQLKSFVQQGATFDPGSSGLASDAILEMVQQSVALREWRDRERARSGTFGFGSVPTTGFPPPTPFQQTYGFSPHAPNLHGQPIGSAPEGSTFEMLGQDMVVRQKPPESLAEQRGSSGAYRTPGSVAASSSPPFSADIYSGQSTILDERRARAWQHEKRGKTAHRGPFEGENWPDQQKQLGRMSAQEAAASFNRTGGVPLDLRLPYEWLHLFAFSIGGQDNNNPQDPRNFVVGTQFANYYHLIFEKVAKDLAKGKHPVLIRAEARNPLSPEWRIYRHIIYSISLIEEFQGTFDQPEPILVARKTVTRIIPCLETPQVHISDEETLRDEILKELGIVTPGYQKAVDALFGGSSSSSSSGGRFGADAGGQEQQDLQRALVGSVQEIAAASGVLDDFEVGHADGKDNNCSILAVFAAAGVPISPKEARAYREQLYRQMRVPPSGALDLADPTIAAAINAALFPQVGHRRIVVLRPEAPRYARTPVTGSGSEIYLFYASGHFSPARPR